MTERGQILGIHDAIETGFLVALLAKGQLPLTYEALRAFHRHVLGIGSHRGNQVGTLFLVHVVNVHAVLAEGIQEEGVLGDLLDGDVVHVTTIDVGVLLMEGSIIYVHGISGLYRKLLGLNGVFGVQVLIGLGLLGSQLARHLGTHTRTLLLWSLAVRVQLTVIDLYHRGVVLLEHTDAVDGVALGGCHLRLSGLLIVLILVLDLRTLCCSSLRLCFFCFHSCHCAKI